MATVLLEIGTEEMPAGYLPPALAQLAALARARLAADRLAYEGVQTWGTPRRLALLLTGVAEHQAPMVREVRGPAIAEAFDAHGEPTPATIGFARGHGALVGDLRIKAFDGAEFITAIFRDEGRPVLELLPAAFTHLLNSLTFPKTMRWGAGSFRFARPVRWIAAMIDDRVVPFTVDAVTAGRSTRGHRFLAPGAVEIPTAADYPRVMDENHVLLDPVKRAEAIREQLDAIAGQDNAAVADDGALLNETVFTVEYPTAVRCTFDPAFLALPEEVLLQTLREEQQFFPLREITGRLLPAFIAVRNGDKAYLGTVRDGYEAVARAKLLDARFFFEQDRARSLADRVEDLREVVLLERAGTLHDKATRLAALAGWVADALALSAPERAMAARAALLCKADLTTAMVIEHPDLHGVMGCVYARLSGEAEPVAMAIQEHVLPRDGSGGRPSTALGNIVALCDRLDTTAACFDVGLIPTGADDPYALRAAALGVVRILLEAGLRLPLSRLIGEALAHIAAEPAQPLDEVQAALDSFFAARVAEVLAAAGIPADVSAAVRASLGDCPADAGRAARALTAIRGTVPYQALLRAAARVQALARDDDAAATPAMEPAAMALAAHLDAVEPDARALAQAGEMETLLERLLAFTPLVDRFLADSTGDHGARMALARRAAACFSLLADFSVAG